jgi:Rieske 2Fe-2S family protein
MRTRLARLVNNRLNTEVGNEDADLVANVQAGLETRGLELGPLSHREAAIAWFADRVRADLE